MTEEEALTKTCPQAMSRNDGDALPCVGAKCMAWRWDEFNLKSPPTKFLDKPLFRPDYDYAQPVGGYCGLAGRP